jgi:hypothetical protein
MTKGSGVEQSVMVCLLLSGDTVRSCGVAAYVRFTCSGRRHGERSSSVQGIRSGGQRATSFGTHYGVFESVHSSRRVARHVIASGQHWIARIDI